MAASTQRGADACTRALRNTLSSQCYSSCNQAYPLCVNYAARPSNESLKEGDGNYYYQGCAYTYMQTCTSGVGAAQCELQCLQSKNTLNEEWILDVAPPQADRLETSLFVHVEKLNLPPTLKHMKIVGTTELTRKVPMGFEPDALASGTGLLKVTLMDLDVGNITTNIFPSNLDTLIIRRTLLTVFEPVGKRNMSQLRVLDLSENQLTKIPDVVYKFPKLSELYLGQNPIDITHITAEELSFLRGLDTFDANITAPTVCGANETIYMWEGKKVCYKDASNEGGLLDGTLPQSDDKNGSVGTSKTSTLGIIIFAIAAFAVLAIIVGIFLLRRAKRRKNEAAKSVVATEQQPKNTVKNAMRSLFAHRKNDLSNPLEDMSGFESPARKATFREIPAVEVKQLEVIAETSAVIISLGQYNNQKVFVNRLRVSEDPAENCETALSVTPVVSQLRHPQLLAVIGFMWEDVHTMSAICEHMNRGTLEDYLLATSTGLTWQNFKLRAAMDVAGCLMYLHGQSHKLTYDGLCGRTVFVDSNKGCKLSTLIACLPNGLMRSHVVKSTRAFCAPEVMAGEAPVAASDMYAFGVLLAQLDTCETADQMIRSSLRQRSIRDIMSVHSDSSSATAPPLPEDALTASQCSSRSSGSTSLLSMFTFTNDCPGVVRELAHSCLQIDPSMRPSAQYASAMLQHLQS